MELYGNGSRTRGVRALRRRWSGPPRGPGRDPTPPPGDVPSFRVSPPYPPAERLDLVETLHGHRVADPYRWLEDADDPRTQAWSAAQDGLARTHLELPNRLVALAAFQIEE